MMRPLAKFWQSVAVAIALACGGGAMAQTADTMGYVLGPDDAVTINVYGQPEASVSTRIKSNGTVVIPLIGSLRAAGETSVSLADTITKKFVSGGFYKNPIVNVEVGGFVSKQVYVAGKVGAPGIFPLDRNYRVLEMLLKAGWVNSAGANYVYLRRGADYKEQRLDIEALVRGGADKDPYLQPGDTLYVPDAEIFFVYGQIGRPGTFGILPGMTIRQALALAGGVTAAGASNKVGLYRAGAPERTDVDLDQKVQRNDVIFVRERLF